MPGAPDERAAVERALMDRARAHSARDHEKPPRRMLLRVIALALALSLVTVVLLGFDAFLTSVQKFMAIKIEDPAPQATDPMPAYVVPPEVSPPPTADQDPRPSPAQAPDTSPATP
jgi:hypothetical protein